jgi:hypothetical protein
VEYWSDGILSVTPNTPIPPFSDFRFVNVAPAPVLTRLEGLDDPVTTYMEMFPGAAVRDESQQPTWPQVRHRRRCTHGEPILKQSSHPSALGITGRIIFTWGSIISFMSFILVSPAGRVGGSVCK